jgi:hypothetical protein
MMDNLEEEYFLWLCEKIDCRASWKSALRSLHEEEFYSLVPNDDNRGLDGIELREGFAREVGIKDISVDWLYVLNQPCSVLEMLIALAERMDYILFDPINGEENQTSRYFWLLIKNLKLKQQPGRNKPIISRLLERRYAPSGVGGLFPLSGSDRDQRGVEIWYQMMNYISAVLL